MFTGSQNLMKFLVCVGKLSK